ncbi:MAG: hypothetical protein R3236_10995, partial [Phycisphaeraceae bacterium]|nr:hypothetical protein [Phycisphaeraceae bacterium]
AALSPRWRRSASALNQLKNNHRGERCVIMGNGPSLGRMDLTPLGDEYTFGMNRIYLLVPELDWRPSFYVSVNTLVIEQCAQGLQNHPMVVHQQNSRCHRWFPGNLNLCLSHNLSQPA